MLFGELSRLGIGPFAVRVEKPAFFFHAAAEHAPDQPLANLSLGFCSPGAGGSLLLDGRLFLLGLAGLRRLGGCALGFGGLGLSPQLQA